MTEAFGGSLDQCCEILKLDFSSSELAQMAAEKGFSQATLEHIEDYFKGDFTEISTILGYQPNNKLKILFGIRTTDDNKQYQTAYTRMFLKNNVTDYSKLDADVKQTQEAGAMTSSEFDCTDLHEYVVEGTNFAQPAAGAMPFPPANQGQTPWGQQK